MNADRFASLYTDPGLDLLWVSAHGEFHHAHPDRTALHLSDAVELEIDWLAALDGPADKATPRAQHLQRWPLRHSGRPLGFGLGPMLAAAPGGRVAPVANAHGGFGSLGVVLAQALVEHDDILKAFDDAVGALLYGRDSLIERLQTTPVTDPGSPSTLTAPAA